MAIILHMDLDAFFASCEHLRRDDGRPVAICMYSNRGGDAGAISTADYTCREIGIHAAVPIATAKELASEHGLDVAFVPADKAYYKDMSERVMAIVAEYAQDTEQASIDECYADLSHLETYDAAVEQAKTLKAAINEALGLTVSVGIGPNVFVAKMASDMEKPDGLTVLRPDEVRAALDPLPVSEIHGVGPKTADTLAEHGIEHVTDLRETPAQRLIGLFGESRGTSLYRKARGQGRERLKERERKQFSRMRTLASDATSVNDLRPTVREFSTALTERLSAKNKRFKQVTITVITPDRDAVTRSRTLDAPSTDENMIYETALKLARAVFADTSDLTVRRFGVGIGRFSDGNQTTLGAF